MILPIITYPNIILRQKAKKVKDPKSKEIKSLILDMLETLEKVNGLGLAAPQVGVSVQLCVVKNERGSGSKTHILINPKIVRKSWGKEVCEEGCLSFPGKFIPIKRCKKVTVKALDKKGEKITIKAEGLLSRAMQHEIDHLDGVLFIDR
ncbi:MAG: peptide deformylase [Candidatus Moranbacteria bacterium RIFOXYA12_FULL_35_19]|nr:MAG: Peptide deformylase [Candidatus Moranbacteria bacterium GW2011_GWF2_35_39]OGI32058.1 MAG: peptide deformylase [Candidatus Moranbacteria bacterium RIFOXYB12_FULL_35_8]OGI32250.1 MAG: peptide deformylase [Candidatus Moranbacteria bacterium RIFOXYC12_FULL_36_13]OGI35887.1 MAG: peptide deformylase [Candidatus Moranbacteria bacterium RIFOXYA12_FULL_35_19]